MTMEADLNFKNLAFSTGFEPEHIISSAGHPRRDRIFQNDPVNLSIISSQSNAIWNRNATSLTARAQQRNANEAAETVTALDSFDSKFVTGEKNRPFKYPNVELSRVLQTKTAQLQGKRNGEIFAYDGATTNAET